MSESSLKKYNTVFCDSLAALNHAYDDGLSKDARILTLAPAVAVEGPSTVCALDQEAEDAQRELFATSLQGFSKELYDVLKRSPKAERFAVTVSRQTIRLHAVVLRLLGLSNDDFTNPRLVLDLKTGDSELDKVLASPVSDVLNVSPEMRHVFYNIPVQKTVDATRPPLWNWLYLTNVHELTYRFLRRWWQNRRPGAHRRRAIVVSENELLKETTCHLAGLGYAVLHQQPPKPSDKISMAPIESIADAISLIQDPTRQFLQRWLPEHAVAPCMAHFEEMLRTTLSHHVWGVDAWAKVLDPKILAGRSAVLVNCPMSSIMVALSEYCQANKVPLIAFQHGVSREICETHDQLMVNFENSVSDLFLVFNDSAKKVSDGSHFACGSTQVAGLPTHFRAVTRPQKMEPQPILYVSTSLYSGNINASSGKMSDIDRCKNEISIVDGVLSELPHRVLYKTYPAGNRYADPDPVLKHLDQAKNIDVFDDPINLKNLIAKHRVVITSRATSTLSVCLMSGRPLVFLDIPDHMPLRPELKEEFDASLFLFDIAKADVLDDLKAFLSRPIEDIEAEWEAKAAARQKMIRSHIEGPGRGAGKRAAQAVHQLVSQSERAA